MLLKIDLKVFESFKIMPKKGRPLPTASTEETRVQSKLTVPEGKKSRVQGDFTLNATYLGGGDGN